MLNLLLYFVLALAACDKTVKQTDSRTLHSDHPPFRLYRPALAVELQHN